MKKMSKKAIALVISITLLMGDLSVFNRYNSIEYVYADTIKSEYIVVTKTEKAYKDVRKNYKNRISSKRNEYKEKFKDNRIEIYNLSEKEANDLSKEDDIVTVEKNINVNISSTEQKVDINKKNRNWNLKMINAEDYAQDNAKKVVKVAIIDSGVDYIDQVNIKERHNLVPDEEGMSFLCEDATCHGTAIAGIICATTGKDNDVKGINSNVELYSIKVFDETNKAPLSRIIDALYLAIEKDVDIINISWGTTEYSEALDIAIKAAIDAGILIVAASGNYGKDGKVEYPAAFEGVLSVGSVNSQGEISEFTSCDGNIDVFAPGESIKSTAFLDGTIISSGTSLAVPHVVGIASILWERDKTKSAQFIKDIIKSSSNNTIMSNDNENGIIDLKYAEEIYDDFAKNFNINSNKINNKYTNNSKIKTFDGIESVSGSWHAVDHVNAVEEGINLTDCMGKAYNDSESKEAFRLIKFGMRVNDRNIYLDTTSDTTIHRWWHALRDKKNDVLFNYIASARFLNMLIKTKDCNVDNVKQPAGLSNHTFKNMKEEVNYAYKYDENDSDFADIWQIEQKIESFGFKANNKNKRYVYWGMLLHILTDAYAHRSYRDDGTEWKLICDDDDAADTTNDNTTRYAAAKQVVKNIMNNRINIEEPYNSLYFEYLDLELDSTYYNRSFRLENLMEFSIEANIIRDGYFEDEAKLYLIDDASITVKSSLKTKEEIDNIYDVQ